MLRGVRIDLESSRQAVLDLIPVTERDLRGGALSDEAIRSVNTVIRSLEGALGKTANEIYQRFGEGKATPYFPIAKEPAKFPNLLNKHLPGVEASRPDVAATIERQQPYHLNQEPLGLLKKLYRENHHHDFSIQEKHEAHSFDIKVAGELLSALDTRGMTIGGGPPWRGIPLDPENSYIDIPEIALPGGEFDWMHLVVTYNKGHAIVYINGQPMMERKFPPGKAQKPWIDWYFSKLKVSVLGTLIPLHNLCVKACEEVWESSDL